MAKRLEDILYARIYHGLRVFQLKRFLDIDMIKKEKLTSRQLKDTINVNAL